MESTSSEIIKAARRKRKLSQGEFANKYLGIKQPQLSKYENNKSKVPGEIIILCQNIIFDEASQSEKYLAKRVLKELAGKHNYQARLSLGTFLDVLMQSNGK